MTEDHNSPFKPCIIIPCYRHVTKLLNNLDKLCSYGIHLYIIDDGNTSDDLKLLNDAIQSFTKEMITILNLEQNSGKGSAVIKGFLQAYQDGYTHALQIDADGQQDIDAISSFFKLAQDNPKKIILGVPLYSKAPIGRLIGRYITHFWVGVELGMMKVVDSMCGMRVYPLAPTCKLLGLKSIGKRMDFDTEILVRLYWMGVDFIEKQISVSYPKDGFSNFAMLKDNVRISLMHTRLVIEKIIHFRTIHNRCYLK